MLFVRFSLGPSHSVKILSPALAQQDKSNSRQLTKCRLLKELTQQTKNALDVLRDQDIVGLHLCCKATTQFNNFHRWSTPTSPDRTVKHSTSAITVTAVEAKTCGSAPRRPLGELSPTLNPAADPPTPLGSEAALQKIT